MILEFIKEHAGEIIISAVVGLTFFVLGPLGLWFSKRKIKREKIAKTKENLLDLVEGMLVNQEKITEGRLLSIFYSISRENSIELEIEHDIEDLMEDLILRFQRSKHLSAEQKDAYISQIEAQQETFFNNDQEENDEFIREIPKTYKRLFEQLEESVKNDNKEKAQEQLNELKEKLIGSQKHEPEFLGIYKKIYLKNPSLFFAAIGVVISIYAALIYFLF